MTLEGCLEHAGHAEAESQETGTHEVTLSQHGWMSLSDWCESRSVKGVVLLREIVLVKGSLVDHVIILLVYRRICPLCGRRAVTM